MYCTIRRSFSSEPELLDLTWFELVNLYKGWADVPMQGPTPTEKPADLPLIVFGAMSETDAKGRGCRRGNLHPAGLWCMAYDFDDADPDTFASILTAAKRMSHGLVHTTWKHGLTRPPGTWATEAGPVRARIILPAYQPGTAPAARSSAREDELGPGYIQPSRWETLWWTVAGCLGAAVSSDLNLYPAIDTYLAAPGSGLDVQCRNIERLYYLPARNVRAPFACHLESWGE